MACNVGGVERPIRIVLGILLIESESSAVSSRSEWELRWPSGRSHWSQGPLDFVRHGACSALIPVRRLREQTVGQHQPKAGCRRM